ncbi:hypothetical protein PTKIN_Ptkin10aG0048600 [Pterospermum kingtungense]
MGSVDLDWKKVWNGLLPPKIETFYWQVLHGKVAVKANLLSGKAIHKSDIRCALLVWRLNLLTIYSSHAYFLGRFGLNGVMLGVLNGNDIVFKGKLFEVGQVIVIIRLRLLMWVRAKWPEASSWSLKFNVDGSSLGKPGPAGVGWILRDHHGNELIRFSKSIGVEDSNVAELLAIREAFILFLSSTWVMSSKLIVESDSMVAVDWARKPSSVPCRVRNFINHLENLKLKCKDWKIVHIFRKANQVADKLAKEEVQREASFVLFSNG